MLGVSDLLQIAGVPEKRPDKPKPATDGTLCARPGHNIITHCVEPKDHDASHTYAPVPEDDDKMSDRLDSVMRLLTQSCPDYTVADFKVARPHHCPMHKAAATVIEAQEILRVMRR